MRVAGDARVVDGGPTGEPCRATVDTLRTPTVVATGAAVTAVAVVESFAGWPYAPFPLAHATLAVAIPLLSGAAPGGRPWPEVRRLLPWQQAPLAAAAVFVGGFAAVYALLLSVTGWADDPAVNLVLAYRDLAGEYVTRHGRLLTLAVSYLLLGVWPMFGEELFYRGFVLRGLLPTGAASASVVTSVLFALRHAGQLVYHWPDYPVGAGLSYFVWAFGVSLLWCWVYVRSGSLWLCIASHGVNLVLAPLVLLALDP